MDKLIPLDVSVRHQQKEQLRKRQQTQMNQRHFNQQFGGGVKTTDKGSAFNDTYTASVYAQIRANDAELKDKLVHATGSAPYQHKEKEN
jgi:hypothetical protein